jgi:hypothetical protein
VAAATSRLALALLVVICAARVAHAQAPGPTTDLDHTQEMPLTDAQIIGTADNSWHFEDAELRTAYLSQYGHGFQSQDGSIGAAGSEAMHIFEPWALFDIRQNDHITHQVMLPVDIITAASPDAVDAISTASRQNESADLDVRSTYRPDDVNQWNTRFRAHGEEPLGGGLAGAGYTRHLADDNATIGVDANVDVDGFDSRDVHGKYHGKVARETANANLTASQLLSPTTVVDASYGITYQHGVLDPSSWNAVPLSDGSIIGEIFPDHRVRQAISARISQIIPATRTTFKAWYRYYTDDFQLHAHTVELVGYQYIVPWIYLRGSYRYYTQTGVDFFTTRLEVPFDMTAPHTSDSDLAPFDANEWSVQAVMVRGRAPKDLKPWNLSAEVMHYWRTNDLRITTVALTVGRSFL